MTPLTNKNWETNLPVSQRRFVYLIGFFVIVTSFVYGFVKGSSTPAVATAALLPTARPVEHKALPPHVRALLPSDARLASMGNDLAINGIRAEMLTFSVGRDLTSFVMEIGALWRRQGLELHQHTSDRRAISFAVDRDSGRRVSLVVWEVPESIQWKVTQVDSFSTALQGTLSMVEAGEERKFLPGFPVMPDAIVGSVVASTDLEQRTFTASYSNPGIVAESVNFYDSALALKGWQALASGAGDGSANERRYKRGVQDLVLIFAEIPQVAAIDSFAVERTMMTAILSVPISDSKSVGGSNHE